MTAGVMAATVPASSMVTPGILGFLVFAALAVALVFLLKSMNKQFRKITPEPGPPEGGGDPVGVQQDRDPARTPD